MTSRALSIFALVLLTVGLLAGTAGPLRAMAPHHQHHHGMTADAGEPCATEAAGHAAPCDRHHDGDGTPTHRHGGPGCVCMVGACDLTVLPARLESVAYARLAGLLPAAERMPAARIPTPPLRPPRA